MNKLLLPLFGLVLFLISGCSQNESRYPVIGFKTSAGYTYGDVSLPPGSEYKIAVVCRESELRDKLSNFRVTKSINDSAAVLFYETKLAGDSATAYTYEYESAVSTIPGRKITYTYTVTTENDLTNTVSTSLWVSQ